LSINILTIDPGAKTGWASLHGDKIRHGVEDFTIKKGESAGMQLIRFECWLEEIIKLTEPKLVVYEEVKSQWIGPSLDLQRFVAIIQSFCEKRGLNYTFVNPAALKRWATGKGNASKELMLAFAEMRNDGPDKIENNHEADAFLMLKMRMEGHGD